MSTTRYLQHDIQNDALKAHKMAFISGPRQVGKTTCGKTLLQDPHNYFTWDDIRFQRMWRNSSVEAVSLRGEGPILLDEIHKDRKWKNNLKALYDIKGEEVPIIVTDSARLDIFRRGGDSLLGRYIPYRMHPFSVGESAKPIAPDHIFESTKVHYPWQDLMALGGFPEALFSSSQQQANRWSRLRLERLIAEDIRDFRNITDVHALKILADLLPEKVGSLLSINGLKEDVGVAYATLRAWIILFEALYICFLVKPYAQRATRMLRAEPKLYLYDILQFPKNNQAARLENLLALHLLKACHYWTDMGFGVYELRFLRDKEKREVDFLVLEDRKPWLMVECKSNSTTPSKNLLRFAEMLKPKYIFQLVSTPNFDKFYADSKVRVVDYERFCAGLV